MSYCDHHGWRWEPGQGPSPCIGETASFVLAFAVFLYAVTVIRGVHQQGLHHRVVYNPWSCAYAVHAFQMVLCVAQAFLAVAGGMLIARSRGMPCVALSLHSATWAVSWAISAFALLRSPASSKRSLWFWCCALISNSIVLSSLRRASEATGRHLPIEIGCLSWISFFANAVLVVLQLAKPDLEDTESVYVRVVGHEGVVPSTATGNHGWQAFWAGGADTFDPAAAGSGSSSTRNRTSRSWWHFGGRQGSENDLEGGGAWPSGGSSSDGTLNESLLGTSAFDDRTGIGGAPTLKANEGGQGGGCFQRVGCFLRRTNPTAAAAAAAATAAAAAAAEDEEEGRRQQDSPFGILRGGSSSLRAQQALGGGGGGGGSSSSYPGAASIGARAPPQVAAPVLGVAVSRWRLVDADGIPSAHGSSGDVVWTERSRHESSSSVRTAALSGSDFGAAVVDGRPRDHSNLSSVSASAAMNDFDPGEAKAGAGAAAGPGRVEFELLVRASGRGEMDWWGRDPPGGGAAAAAASADGDWRVWRSAADTLALYDALALRFGPEFGRRVSRPSFKTHKKHVRFAVEESDDGSRSPPTASRRSPPPLMVLPGALHRVDILSDAKKVGAFLRSLMGLRQFLSTAVMDYLAQPPPAALPPDAVPHGDGGSDTSDAGYITSDDILEEDRGAQQGAGGHGYGHDGATAAGGASGNHRPFSGAKDADGGPSAGQAVAVAALATDYGAWLKRLAVRLRRATPAGERFVRLRCIGPAVTGEQVVWWLVTSSGECEGDRATAVRLGQDLVSHRLLTPVCAGYTRPKDPPGGSSATTGAGAEGEPADLFGSFDDAAGWLFAFEGDALRNPFAPPPPIQVAVMTNTGVEVSVTGWVETSDDEGVHVSFVVHTQVEATQEAWDSPRRYREFTQLRKRLLRLGIDIPTSAGTRNGDAGSGDGGGLAPDLPKKTWRTNKFDEEHLETRRAALEAYLRAAVKGALSAPHLSGHLLTRFLDPDESRLRILSEPQSRNPFAGGGGGGGFHHYARAARGAAGSGGGGARARGGSGDDGGGKAAGAAAAAAGESGGVQEESVVGESFREDRAEEEDFDNLTDSIGGFG